METKSLLTKTCVAAAFGLFSMQASAIVMPTETLMYNIDGENDCNGYFGTPDINGFGGCNIRVPETGERLSPVIAKIDVDDEGVETSRDLNTGIFPSITGDEFTITYGDDTSYGTWSYDGAEAPDPNVRYWVAKGGNGFNLFWTVDASATMAGGACDGAIFTNECLAEAKNVFSGEWYTPGGEGLSHLTFYDTGEVPVPAAVWLFGSGLLGLVGVARRRQA